MIRIIALVVFLFLSFETANALVFTLASRFLVRLPTLTTNLSRIRNLNLPPATQKVKFFIEKYGKQILMVAAIGSIMDILMREQESYDPSLADYCYTPDGGLMLCTFYSYSSSCYCQVGGNNPQWFYTIQCSYTGGGASGYINAVTIRRKSDLSWYAGVPAPGVHHVEQGAGTADFEVTLKVAPCPGFSSDSSPDDTIPMPVDDAKVFPNPYDFFQPSIITSETQLQQLNTIREQIINDPSIPLVPASVFDNVDDVDVKPLVNEPSELTEDMQSQVTQDMIKDNPTTSEDDAANVTFPDIDGSISSPEKRSFPFELFQTVINSHPILRLLSSASISASGGSCTLSSSVFTLDFCPFSWVFQLMGVVIVFIATVAPFVYTRD